MGPIEGQPETRKRPEPEDDDESLFAFAVLGFLRRSCGLGKGGLVQVTARRGERSAFESYLPPPAEPPAWSSPLSSTRR